MISLHLLELSRNVRSCPENSFSILSLAARRKGIARFAVLHLDCARFANGRSLSVRVREAIVWAETALKVALQSLCENPARNREFVIISQEITGFDHRVKDQLAKTIRETLGAGLESRTI